MEQEQTLKEKGQQKLKEWKSQAKELNHQLHLGTVETKEEFEKQKKRLTRWLDSLAQKVENSKDVTKEKALSIKSSLEELRVQATLGKAETEEHLKEQQKKIALGLHNLKQNLSEVLHSSKEGTHELVEEVSDQLDDFHTRFDLFRLQFHLGKIEAKKEWDEKKKELSHKLSVVKAKLLGAEKATSNKWEGFSSEMGDAWGHFKKAFKN